MKKTICLISLIVIALSASGCQQPTAGSENVNVEMQKSDPNHLPIYSERIRSATLLIRIESLHADGVTFGFDMATLVQYQGETYLVTHNHYGEMLEDLNIVQLRDADNHRVISLYGYEFKSLIVYQDPGTLVLHAPDDLTDVLTPVSIDDQPQLQPGDIVQVAYRGGAKRDQVELLDAVVERITTSGVTPVYRLRFPDGQLLSPGDSGGGVWHGGTLIGNTWSVVLVQGVAEQSGASDSASQIQTNFSYAAMIPEMFR